MQSSTNQTPLPPGQQLVAKNKWPVIGEREPANPTAPAQVDIFVSDSCANSFSLADLNNLKQTESVVDIHCVTRWSKLQVKFEGVLLEDLLAAAGIAEPLPFISFVANSDRHHSTSLSIEDALEHQTLIATKVDGLPLHIDHGGPIRNIVPGKYFYKSVKWLNKIELLEQDRLGFWEATAGYHNHADPWKEERYMSPNIDRRGAAKLLASRNFDSQDLRSIDVSNMELDNLTARNALLRDANFQQTNLMGANFSGANLSNAHFQNANLRDTKFCGADLEGANLSGADLSGADFSECSLFGASFCEFDAAMQPISAAVFDRSTILPDSIIDPLVPQQQEFVRNALKS